MKKKGFTLIELLAVIVILAIIALIVTPVISTIIENAKMSAAKDSAFNYIDAVRNQIALSIVEKDLNFADGEYDVVDLRTTYGVTVKGKYPTTGTVTIADEKVTQAEFCISNYMAYYNGGKTINILGSCEDPRIDATMVYHNGKPLNQVLDELHEG